MKKYQLNIDILNEIKEEVSKLEEVINKDIYDSFSNTILKYEDCTEGKKRMICGNMVSVAVRMFKMNSRKIALEKIVNDLKSQKVFDSESISHQTIRELVETNKSIFLDIGFSTKVYQQFGRKEQQGVVSESGLFLIDEEIGNEISNYLEDELEAFKNKIRVQVFDLIY